MSPVPPVTGTGISVVSARQWSAGVIFQLLNGHLDFVKHKDGVWSPGESLFAKPTDGSPIASITYHGGKQIRVYYLDENYFIQELCFTEDNGWYIGEIHTLKARATPGSGLAAIIYGALQLGDGEEGDHIRVYYQDYETQAIKELANDGYWHQGDLHVDNAYGGTSLAAVTYYFQHQTQIRVYYQNKSLELKEYGHNNKGWFAGAFNPGQATVGTPLGALVFGGVELQVYWRDLHGHVVFARNTGAWGHPTTIEPIGPGYKLAVLQWDNGKYLRIYYQLFNGGLVEICSDDGGHTWFQGKFKP